jgi:hypothetical protein
VSEVVREHIIRGFDVSERADGSSVIREGSAVIHTAASIEDARRWITEEKRRRKVVLFLARRSALAHPLLNSPQRGHRAARRGVAAGLR